MSLNRKQEDRIDYFVQRCVRQYQLPRWLMDKFRSELTTLINLCLVDQDIYDDPYTNLQYDMEKR